MVNKEEYKLDKNSNKETQKHNKAQTLYNHQAKKGIEKENKRSSQTIEEPNRTQRIPKTPQLKEGLQSCLTKNCPKLYNFYIQRRIEAISLYTYNQKHSDKNGIGPWNHNN